MAGIVAVAVSVPRYRLPREVIASEWGTTAAGGEKAVANHDEDSGLKSFGHPIGATGVRMIYEVCQQLWHKAGARQVKDAEIGLAHNLGGPGAVGCVTVLANA